MMRSNDAVPAHDQGVSMQGGGQSATITILEMAKVQKEYHISSQ